MKKQNEISRFLFTVATVLLFLFSTLVNVSAASTVSIEGVNIPADGIPVTLSSGTASLDSGGTQLTLTNYSGSGPLEITGDVTVILAGVSTINYIGTDYAVISDGNLTFVSNNAGSLLINTSITSAAVVSDKGGIKAAGDFVAGDGNPVNIEVHVTSDLSSPHKLNGITAANVSIENNAKLTVSGATTRTDTTTNLVINGIESLGDFTVATGGECTISEIHGLGFDTGERSIGVVAENVNILGNYSFLGGTGRLVYGLVGTKDLSIGATASVNIKNIQATNLEGVAIASGVNNGEGGNITIAEGAKVSISDIYLAEAGNWTNCVAAIYSKSAAGVGGINIAGTVTIDNINASGSSYGVISQNNSISISGSVIVSNIDSKEMTIGLATAYTDDINVSGKYSISDTTVNPNEASYGIRTVSGNISISDAEVAINMQSNYSGIGIGIDSTDKKLSISDSTVNIEVISGTGHGIQSNGSIESNNSDISSVIDTPNPDSRGIFALSILTMNGGWFEAWSKNGKALQTANYAMDSNYEYVQGNSRETAVAIHGNFAIDPAATTSSLYEYVSLGQFYNVIVEYYVDSVSTTPFKTEMIEADSLNKDLNTLLADWDTNWKAKYLPSGYGVASVVMDHNRNVADNETIQILYKKNVTIPLHHVSPPTANKTGYISNMVLILGAAFLIVTGLKKKHY